MAASSGPRLALPATVHATAIVAPGAVLAPGVCVGPYCVVGPRVRLGSGTHLRAHCVVDGATSIGENCELHPFCVVGGAPQDRKHCEADLESRLAISDRCVIREHVTVNGGTSTGGGLTTIGPGTLLLAGSHVGHDCRVGAQVVVSNRAQLAGHICIGDYAVLGGDTSLRQFINIGSLAMVGGASAVDKHVMPFSLVQGNRARLLGANLVGLRRRGISKPGIRMIQQALAMVQDSSGTLVLSERVKAYAMKNGITLSSASQASGDQTWGEPPHLPPSQVDLAYVQQILEFCLGVHGNELQYSWGNVHRKIGITI
mmetsp:Transcript_13949/g.39543  ORF Transcript_13949/g.39543 Transcript_13949/m.39543 type:complete len:314 (-) Transcript_13949:149-1090(-)